MNEPFDDIMRPHNDGAPEIAETRVGVPLDTVLVKMRDSLCHMHHLMQLIEEHVPDDLPLPPEDEGKPFGFKEQYLLHYAMASFRAGFVAFLALSNNAGIAKNEGLLPRLAKYSHDQLYNFLERLRIDGSVNG